MSIDLHETTCDELVGFADAMRNAGVPPDARVEHVEVGAGHRLEVAVPTMPNYGHAGPQSMYGGVSRPPMQVPPMWAHPMPGPPPRPPMATRPPGPAFPASGNRVTLEFPAADAVELLRALDQVLDGQELTEESRLRLESTRAMLRNLEANLRAHGFES
jgi:hypothetical protein